MNRKILKRNQRTPKWALGYCVQSWQHSWEPFPLGKTPSHLFKATLTDCLPFQRCFNYLVNAFLILIPWNLVHTFGAGLLWLLLHHAYHASAWGIGIQDFFLLLEGAVTLWCSIDFLLPFFFLKKNSDTGIWLDRQERACPTPRAYRVHHRSLLKPIKPAVNIVGLPYAERGCAWRPL